MHVRLRHAFNVSSRLVTRVRVGLSENVSTPDGHVFAVNRNLHPWDYRDLKRGTYEKDEREMLGEFFVPDDTIIDIGANIGVVATTAFEEKLKDGGKLVCVEPNPSSLRPLKLNLLRAYARFPARHFEVVASAVSSDPEGMAEFRRRNNLCSGLSTATRHHRKDDCINVPTISLTKLMDRHAPNGASLICDAEGAEIDMIFNERSAFRKIRQIAIELHEPELTGRPDITPDTLAREITAMGFDCRARAGNTFFFARNAL